MRLRPHRRNLVVWSSSGRYGAQTFTRLARTGRIRRCIRTGALLTVIGLMRLGRAEGTRWRSALAGVVRRYLSRGGQVQAVLAEISAINAELLARRELR